MGFSPLLVKHSIASRRITHSKIYIILQVAHIVNNLLRDSEIHPYSNNFKIKILLINKLFYNLIYLCVQLIFTENVKVLQLKSPDRYLNGLFP